jgi:hypothetical protein
MEINADFTRRAAVHAAETPWRASPMPGVERRMLDRIGDEKARATSIVRYAPDSHFSAHVHGGGEEFLVIDGVFQDEHGDYPTGTYVRNPPQSSHTPGAARGCTILVKLWQFDPDDRLHICVDTNRHEFHPAAGREGTEVLPLHRDAREDVRLERWAPGTAVSLDLPGGAEVFVLSGAFREGGETFAPHDWLRLPAGAALDAEAGAEGCTVWVKTGHLAVPPRAPEAA